MPEKINPKIISQSDDENLSDESKIEENTLQGEFTLPKKIKQVRIFIALGQVIMGILLIVLPVYYLLNPALIDISLKLLAILGIFAGSVMVILFPTNFARTINSKLILGENTILLRNTFSFTELLWKDIQDILITEKLTSDPSRNVLVGASYIRFRTINKGHYFLVDTYPIDDIIKMKEVIRVTFDIAVKNTGYKIDEKIERPSLRLRFIFYEKVLDKKENNHNE